MLGLDRRVVRITWTVLVVLGVIALAYALRRVLLLLALSVFFAYLIFPLVGLAERWVPLVHGRTRAIVLVYVLLLAGLAGAGTALGPRIGQELETLTQKAPEMTKQIQTGQIIGNVLSRRGWEPEQIVEVERFFRGHAGAIVGYVQQAMSGVLKALAQVWIVVLIPIFAFFILKDAEAFATGILSLLEQHRHRLAWRQVAEDLHLILGQYVRALIVLSLVTAVVWSFVFLLTGVPYALVLAAIGGALEFVPLVGPITAGVIVVTVSLFSGFAHPLALALFIVAWRLIQDYVTSPMVMGHGVEVHPALVIFGVIAGGEIAGIAGMFFSVPVIAAVRIVWRRLRDVREGPRPPAASPRAPSFC